MKEKLFTLPALCMFAIFSFFPLFTEASVVSKSYSNKTDLMVGLKGWWTFDGPDISDKVYDKSGNNNYGYFLNVPGSYVSATSSARVPGKLGQAIAVSSSSGAVDVSRIASSLTTGDISVSAWIKFKDTYNTSSDIAIVFRLGDQPANNDFTFGFGKWNANEKNGKLTLDLWSGGSDNYVESSKSSWSPNRWYHVAVSYSATNGVRLYIDGIQDGSSGPLTRGTTPYAASAYIGRSQNWVSAPFQGTIDDVRVWGRALSATEIRQLYNQGNVSQVNVSKVNKADLKSGLIGWWTFDGADLTDKVYDKSGQGNHGYLTGAATSSTRSSGKNGQGLLLDGINDAVETSSTAFAFERTDNFSFSIWYKYNSVGASANPAAFFGNPVTNAGPGIFFGLKGGGQCSSINTIGIELIQNAGSRKVVCSAVNSAITDGKWHHVVLSYDGSDNTVTGVKIYFDSVPLSVSIPTNTLSGSVISSAKMRIGDDRTSDWFKGTLDEARIYNRILSAAEVKMLYNQSGGKANTSASTDKDLVGSNSGLIGWWTFDGADVTDKVYDKSGQGNHGYVSSGTTSARTAGKFGQALSFNGTDRYVETTNMADNLGEMTVSVWMKTTDNVAADRRLVGKMSNTSNGNGWVLDYSTGVSPGVITFLTQDNNGSRYFQKKTSGHDWHDNKWHHVVATLSGGVSGTIKIYVDGIAVPIVDANGSTQTVVSTTNALKVRIGSNSDGQAASYFPGSLDDVRIYNRALSDTEIRQLYTQGR